MRRTQSRTKIYQIGEIKVESYSGAHRIIIDGLNFTLVKREIKQELDEGLEDVEKMRGYLSAYAPGVMTLPEQKVKDITHVFEEIMSGNLENL